MSYSHGTCFIHQATQIEELKSVADLFQMLLDDDASAAVREIDKPSQLSAILVGSTQNVFTAIAHSVSDTSVIFLAARVFRNALADADRERLTEVTSAWAESDSWRNTEVNSFDLFCLLLGLSSLCQKARDTAQDLYLLLSSDSDFLPA